MALVTYVLGNCPSCKAQNAFGNVDVRGDHVYRGCKRCRYHEDVALPPLRKKVIYLDQNFFSHAFRGEATFVAAAERIVRLASLQLVATPFSSVHEDETHQWEKRADLFKFIKANARGHKFEAAYEVEQTQIIQSFQGWIAGKPAEYAISPADAVDQDVHGWESYLRIDVDRYMGEIELIRELKKQSTEGLVDLFDGWRNQQSSFEEDLQAEYQTAGKAYLDFYLEFALRVAGGDYMVGPAKSLHRIACSRLEPESKRNLGTNSTVPILAAVRDLGNTRVRASIAARTYSASRLKTKKSALAA